MNRGEFQGLSQTRLDDSRILLDAGQYSGSYYLGGYSVECALKACIVKNIQAAVLPPKGFVDKIYTHDLTKLLGLARLDNEEPLGGDADLNVNWATVKDWSEQFRYSESTEHEARELLSAIEDQTHGVLVWLKQHW